MKDKIIEHLNKKAEYNSIIEQYVDDIIDKVIELYEELPDECTENWSDTKFCSWGRKCKECANIDHKYNTNE